MSTDPLPLWAGMIIFGQLVCLWILVGIVDANTKVLKEMIDILRARLDKLEGGDE